MLLPWCADAGAAMAAAGDIAHALTGAFDVAGTSLEVGLSVGVALIPADGRTAAVLLQHADGTVTRYGHINSWTVQVGQRVFAGDQIATIGNRGNSTGPHLHFSFLLGGTNATDPVPWLAARGISVGAYAG